MDTKNLTESKRKTVSNEYQNHVEQHLTGSGLNTQTKQESVSTSGTTSASVMTESTMERLKRQGTLQALAQKESEGGNKVDVMRAAADQMARRRAVAAAATMIPVHTKRNRKTDSMRIGTGKRRKVISDRSGPVHTISGKTGSIYASSEKAGILNERDTLIKIRRDLRKDQTNRLGQFYKETTGRNIRREYSRWMTADRWMQLNEGKFRIDVSQRFRIPDDGNSHNFRRVANSMYSGMQYLDRGINRRTIIYDLAKINKNGEMVQTGKKVIRTHRVILPDKKKVISASKYRKTYNPNFMDKVLKNTHDMTIGNTQKLFKDSTKMGLDGSLKKSQQKMEEDGGTGGQMMSMMISAPQRAKDVVSVAQGVKHGVSFAGRATWNTGKFAAQGTKVLAQGTYAGGKLALQGARTLKKDGIKGVAKGAKRVSQEAIKASAEAAKKASRAAVKAAAEMVKKVAMSMLPAITAIFLVIIMIQAIIGVLGTMLGNQTEVVVIADTNSILVAQEYLEELVVEWEENLEDVIESYIIKDDCPYDNNDEVIVEISCMEEAATVQSEYIALYCLLCAKNDLKVNNLGVEKGNDYDSSMPSADTLKAQLAEWFAYINPPESEWGVEQEIKQCQACEFPHDYTITTLSITLRTVTELVASVGLTEEELNTFNSLYGDMMTMLSDGDVDWTQYHTYPLGSLDSLSEEEWLEAYNNAPVLSCTREEFVQNAISQNFSYQYGSKNPASGALDCSGYTSYLFNLYGADIGAGSAIQWENTRAISATEAKAGDLVFKQPPNGNGINHVGIYLGNYASAKFNHCASSTGTVTNNYKGFVIYRRPLYRFADDVY